MSQDLTSCSMLFALCSLQLLIYFFYLREETMNCAHKKMWCNKAKNLIAKRTLSCRCTDFNIAVSWKKIIQKNKHFGVLNIRLIQCNFKSKTKIFHFYRRISGRWALLLPAGNYLLEVNNRNTRTKCKFAQS